MKKYGFLMPTNYYKVYLLLKKLNYCLIINAGDSTTDDDIDGIIGFNGIDDGLIDSDISRFNELTMYSIDDLPILDTDYEDYEYEDYEIYAWGL